MESDTTADVVDVPDITADIVDVLLYKLLLPLAVIYAVKMAGQAIYNYAKKLFIAGKADEWVLIMRNGEMVKAGVGLCAFKGPFDQVATFPARVYKVDFQTEQVTNEMQGVRVSGMLVWSINRIGEGPFNAYKTLGDISSGNPTSANDALVSMSTSVVRSCIANSTIKEMITNRKMLREAIRKEMFDVVKGWGVWLETVEITDVKICSSSLFKDLQTNYRETMRQQATLYQMKVKSEIDTVKNQTNLEVEERVREFNEKENIYVSKIELEMKESKETYLLAKQEISKEKEELDIQAEVFKKEEATKLQQKERELDLEYTLAANEKSITVKKEGQRMTDEQNKTAATQLQRSLENEKIKADSANEIKRAEMELEKRNMDAQMLHHEANMLAKRCYGGKYFEKVNIANMAEEDPSSAVLAGVLTKLTQTRAAIGDK